MMSADTPTKTVGQVALGWWSRSISTDNSEASPGGEAEKRATAARLRRCSTLQDVLLISAVHDLKRQLQSISKINAEKLATLAVALANVDQHDKRSLASRMGEPSSSGQVRVSAIRLQRVVRDASMADLRLQLPRLLRQVDRAANVARLAEDIIFWGERVQNRWCFDYYGAEAPGAEPETRVEERTQA